MIYTPTNQHKNTYNSALEQYLIYCLGSHLLNEKYVINCLPLLLSSIWLPS